MYIQNSGEKNDLYVLYIHLYTESSTKFLYSIYYVSGNLQGCE